MPERESAQSRIVKTVEPIETVIEEMLLLLGEHADEMRDLVDKQFSNDPDLLGEFLEWLKEDDISPEPKLSWLDSLRSNVVDKALIREAAWDCLQVVVLAYLPGPRYFQGAYIYSNLRRPEDLMKVKASFQVPHLSGAVGWMSAYLLDRDNDAPYVVIQDALLDLRGRVAVSDRRLGNRSVLGFPVSISLNNTELSSISGFVFFSHPVPGVFPQPSNQRLSKAFANARKVYGSALASAIESHIFLRYSRALLTERQKSKEPERTPLLTLSDKDPTGFLASILFQSDADGNVGAECEINENVFLEAMAWYLRVASMYPEKWESNLVQQLRRLADWLENVNIHPRFPPILWYSLDPKQPLQRFYPALIPEADVDSFTSIWEEPVNVQAEERSGGIRGALDDLFKLLEVGSVFKGQVDLVVPIYHEQANSTTSLGFFRLNFDVSDIRDPAKVETTLRQIWGTLKEIHDEINGDIARLILALEEEEPNLVTSHSVQLTEKERSEEIQQARLWMDASLLVSEWLAWQMHRLVLRLANPEQLPEMEKHLPAPDENLIRFALKGFSSSDKKKLQNEFDVCNGRWTELFNRPPVASVESSPEITFISFWPQQKLPVFTDVTHIASKKHSSADEEFSDLLLRDPGLLHTLTILALTLGPDEKVSWQDGRRLAQKNRLKMDLGVPTSDDIMSLQVKSLSDTKSRALDIIWEQRDQQGQREQNHIRLKWGCENGVVQRRYLGRVISAVPGTVAHRLGKYILAGLEMILQPEGLARLNVPEFNRRRDNNIHELVKSPDPDDIKTRLGYLERVMLYQEATAAVEWRVLRVRDSPPAFLAVLCDTRVKRPAVLAFRDSALANAWAFYVAREYDAQREAADEYALNLSAISHGYRGPLLQLGFAIDDATTHFYDNQDSKVISSEMAKLKGMITSAQELASDAMYYAWRRTRPRQLIVQRWSNLCEQIEQVIQALDRPQYPKIFFDKRAVDEDIRVKNSPELWRHLLAKLIDNGLVHGDENADESRTFKVFIQPNISSCHLVLNICSFVSPESLVEAATRVREGLTKGLLSLEKEDRGARNGSQKKEDRGSSGYGLVEAYNCCQLLGIDPKVGVDEETSKLVISLWMTQE